MTPTKHDPKDSEDAWWAESYPLPVKSYSLAEDIFYVYAEIGLLISS